VVHSRFVVVKVEIGGTAGVIAPLVGKQSPDSHMWVTIVANEDESLRVVVYRMAEKGFTRMPVVDRATGRFVGLVSLDDLLKARARHLERPLKLRFLLPGGKLSGTEKSVAQ
jgi:CBS domain-containing protein